MDWKGATAGFVCIAAPSLAAAQTTINFSGAVGGGCTVVADANGTLGLSNDSRVLSSTEPGGTQGAATVTTTALGFNVTVSPPVSFAVGPTDADTNTTFATSFSAAGATALSGVTGNTPTPVGLGVTILTIDASATKGSGVFSAGSYTMDTTITCTP